MFYIYDSTLNPCIRTLTNLLQSTKTPNKWSMKTNLQLCNKQYCIQNWRKTFRFLTFCSVSFSHAATQTLILKQITKTKVSKIVSQIGRASCRERVCQYV